VPAEFERIGERVAIVAAAGSTRHDVQIDLGVDILQIEGGRYDAVVQGLHRFGPLAAATDPANQMVSERHRVKVAVRLGSTANGGGCVAGGARVDHGCVRARGVANKSPHLPQAGAMPDASNVRHDSIVVPEGMSPAQVRPLAQRKAQAQVGDDEVVTFLHLHRSRPVDTDVEWRYSYQVIPRDGVPANTPA
jgi:hypothetical protein